MAADLPGIVLGAFLATAGGFAAKFYSYWQERRSLRSAFVGELRAILAVVERQRLIQSLEGQISDMKKSGNISIYTSRVAMSYNAIYLANARNIGILRTPLPERLVSVYNLMAATIETLEIANEADKWSVSLNNPAPQPWLRQSCNQCIEFHEGLLRLVIETRDFAADVINELENTD